MPGLPSGLVAVNANDLGRGERPGRVEHVLQRTPLDVSHDQVRRRLLLDGVDPDDVIVGDAGGRPSLPEERGGEVTARAGARNLMATTRWSEASNALTTIPNPPWPRTSRTS